MTEETRDVTVEIEGKVSKDDDVRFALGVIDDHRRVIAAGKAHRWDIVKWAVTLNVALAGASITLKHQQGRDVQMLFTGLALGVVCLSIWLLWEITRRMTATRNDSLVPERFLIEHGVAVAKITGAEPPKQYEPNYDFQESLIYVWILGASVLLPGFLLFVV
jgi:hypothetical protein